MATNFDLNNYKDIAQKIGNLFQEESRKDVTFVFKDSDVKLKAHKNILEAVSPVFKTMFSGSLPENDEVKIDDISPEVFKLMLSGIYLNDIHSQVKSDVTVVTYANLYYAAEKYDIKDIREIAKKFMIDNCNANTHMLLAKAKLFNLSDLEAKCKKWFQKNVYFVLANHMRIILNDGYFHEFFDLDNLAIKTEFDLYMALQAMVDNKMLLDYSKCLSKIRFLAIETTDILSCELLCDKDKLAVMSNIEAKKFQKTPKSPMPAHLSVEMRKCSDVHDYKRQCFWTALMLNCDKYENYFEDFFKHMEILADSKERTKALIREGRNKTDEKGFIPFDVICKITNDIFFSH